MDSPFSIIFNDSEVKISLFPEGDMCITVGGRDLKISREQVDVLRTILNRYNQEIPES